MRTVVMILAALGLSGCTVAGPSALSNGRNVYNEVINRTSDEQVLEMLVRLRYGESFGMLTVASVTANIKVRAEAGAEIGVGSDSNYRGNLVPLSGGFAYEENPTISYVPLRGERFVSRLLAPLPLSTVVLFGRSPQTWVPILEMMIGQMNGLRNPMFGDESERREFDRAIRLLRELRNEGVAHFSVADEREPPSFLLVITEYEPEYIEAVRQLLDLLGLPAPPADGGDIELPVRLAVGRSRSDSIDLKTRSVLELIRLMGLGVDVPESHLQAGIAPQYTVKPSRSLMEIRSSTRRPRSALVATRFRDHWFYIDETDTMSKMAFLTLNILIGMRLEQEELSSGAPVLTIPVGG
ncbi:MAG: hypothetical protein ACYTJ0_10640 [Planctomycetota bacterium]|jgi:hypothetical protein